ncbi:MAG: hypothetical protein ABR578_00305 [Chromatocurvus sp.]
MPRSGYRAAAGQITATYDELARGSRQQMDSVNSVASAVEELTVSFGAVANAASETSALTTQDLAHASEGAQVAEATAREMERIAHSVDGSSKLVDALNVSAGQINGIIQVIRSIADATRAQSASGDEVASNTETIARSAEANYESAQQTTQAAGKLQELSERLRQAVAHFKT